MGDVPMPKSELGKAIEKQARQQKIDMAKQLKQQEIAARNSETISRATAMVQAQPFIDNVRILDNSSEIIMKMLLEKCNSVETGDVRYNIKDFPSRFQRSIKLEMEKLKQYGMITSTLCYMTGGIATLSPLAFTYFKDKEQARMRQQVEREKDLAINKNEKRDDSDNHKEGMLKPAKLFISHSSKDKAYIEAFVELLEGIGMPDNAIICTSIAGHGIPGGAKIFDWLRMQFTDCKLHVVFALSKNYYESAASLNEMGAAWVTKATETLFVLPGFNFDDIDGCIDSREIGIGFEMDNSELKHRLNELKDTLREENSLSQISQARWERYRDKFISNINLIAQKKDTGEGDKCEMESCKSTDYTLAKKDDSAKERITKTGPKKLFDTRN